MKRCLETERLILRPLERSDADDTQRLFPHWEIVRYLANQVPWPYPADGALTYYRDAALPAMERGDEWHWSLRLKEDPGKLIGCIALMRAENNNRGFWLGRPWQGRGYMSEAVERVTDFWFEELQFPVLRAPKAILNETSRRISKACGMRVIARFPKEFVSGELDTELWEITAQEWRMRRKALEAAL
jgi:ribosomal-protein-alanine N-acetyltransferase